jgi:hypothetical protein
VVAGKAGEILGFAQDDGERALAGKLSGLFAFGIANFVIF